MRWVGQLIVVVVIIVVVVFLLSLGAASVVRAS
jgi:t-SNARE complex subunit (syntaxin)